MSEPVNPNNASQNPFGNNPPRPAYQPGDQAPTQAFYGQQTSPAPAPKKSKAGIIAGAAIAGLLILGGGAYAVTNVLNVAGDKDIAKAIPSDSAVFLQVDLNPSNSQKTAALNLASKIDALVDNDDEYTTEGKDFKEIATDPAFEDLDYETEVKPWIGDKVAVAAWGDFSDAYGNDAYPQDYTYEDSGTEGSTYDRGYSEDSYADLYDDDYLDGKYDDLDQTGKDRGADVTVPNINNVSHDTDGAARDDVEENSPSVVLVYEIKDEAKAKSAAEKVIERNDEIGAYTIHDGYLVLAENDEVISDYVDSIEKGNLSVNETYTSDMKILGGDNIASGWLDFSKMGVDGYLSEIGFDEEGEELKGRVATGVSLTNEGVTSKTKVLGVEGYDSLTRDIAKNSEGVSEIGNFSKDSLVAVSVTGLPALAESVLNEYSKSSPDAAEGFIDSAKEQGFNFPGDFQKIFGSETGIGFTSANAGKDNSYEYRAKGADESKIKDLVGEFGESADLNVEADGDTTVVKYSDGINPTDEKLSTHEKFRDALKDLDEANGAAFIDIDAMEELKNTESQKEDKDYGVLGLTSSHDNEENVTDFTVRWIF